MKTIVTLFAAFFLFSQTSKAQDKPANEKIEALKIAFITKHLNLTTDESQKFWPVYNQYEAEKKQIRQTTIGTIKELKDDGDFTNAEADQAITKYLEFKSKDLDLTKRYIVEFKKILPSTKIAKLVTAEDRFKKMLAKQAQNGGNGNGQKPWKNK